nr:reverse transcriptase domain-containing protein [Tanacetum cinerariifolium]
METTRSQNHAYMSPSHRSAGHRPHGASMRPSHRPAGHRPHGPSMNPMRPNNGARPNRSFFIQAHSYETRPLLKSSAVKTQYKAPWVPTVNRNNPPVNRKFSTGRRNFPTVNRKFPTASRKFTTGSIKIHTADIGRKGKAGSSQNNIDDKGYWESGCSRHMTGNISYLSDFEPFNGGYVSFGQGGCKITGKGTIKIGKLEFENVYFVKDLKYNLFSVSQIYDNKNSVMFTDSECIVLGRKFKLLDDANILLRSPRQHNMYSIDLNNIVPHKDLTCLVAKASADECILWHRRLCHLNVKTMNKLKEVNSRAKIPSNKTTNINKPVEQISVPNKQERQIPTGHRLSIKKTFVVQKKTTTPRSCLRWIPTCRIFKTVGLRWVSTGKIFTSSTTKVDSEPPNGLNAYITNQYECEQTLDVSAGGIGAVGRDGSGIDEVVGCDVSASGEGAARRWLEKEPSCSILTWEDLVSKFINEFFPPQEQHISCLTTGGNTFPKLRDTIQRYVAAAAVNYNKGSGSLPSNTIANPKGELKAITTRSGIVLDGPSDLAEYTIKVPPPLVQKSKPHSQRNFVVPQRDPLHPNIPYPSRMHKQKQQEKDEVQIHKFWQMFKQLHINITLVDALILISKYQKMLKALLSNKEKLLELANIPLNENCSAVILKKLHEKLGDLGKFLIPCGFSELKCKALADLGASINLMSLSVWKKLGLPELISTRMTLELANRAICTLAEITRDVFVPAGKFTFPTDFVIVDYKSDPRVPLILGRPFLQIARTLIDVHGEEMILRDGDERLALNMRHDTSSYSNQPQKESINMINIYDDSSEDSLEELFTTNHQSGNPTFSSHPKLTSPEAKDDIFDPEGCNVLIEKLLDLDSTKDLHPPHHVNPLSGSTTSSSSPNQLLEKFADELALNTFPPGNDDLSFDIETNLKKIEYLLYHDPIKDIDSILKDLSNHADPNDNLVDTMPEMFTDEHVLDYSSPLLYDEYDDDLFEVDSDTKYVYIDPFDSKGEKIKESKLLIDELDLPSDFIPSPEYGSFLSEGFFEVDALPSTKNEDKVFNLGILIWENIFEIITRVVTDKNLAIFHAFSILKDFDPPLYELPFFKEVPRSKTILPFTSENEEKVFKPGILTYEEVHSPLISELSHRAYKVFKINQILKSSIEIFLLSRREDIHILDVPCLYFYPP